jgi:hypothetical protein
VPGSLLASGDLSFSLVRQPRRQRWPSWQQVQQCGPRIVEPSMNDAAAQPQQRRSVVLAGQPETDRQIDGMDGFPGLAADQGGGDVDEPGLDLSASSRSDPALRPTVSAVPVTGSKTGYGSFAEL